MKGYLAQKKPIAYKRDPNKAPHVSRNWPKHYAEQAKFDIQLGRDDWPDDPRPRKWIYEDQAADYALLRSMSYGKDRFGLIFGPPSDDESMTD